jgi:hypothetical protein
MIQTSIPPRRRPNQVPSPDQPPLPTRRLMSEKKRHALKATAFLSLLLLGMSVVIFRSWSSSGARVSETPRHRGNVHWLQAVTLVQSSLVSLARVIPPGHEIGQLVFLNNGRVDVTLPSVVLTSANGTAITFTGPLTVPALDPPTILVTGFAVQTGAGIVPLLNLIQACCGVPIIVKNVTTFTRTVAIPPNDRLQQSDIDTAAQPLNASLRQEALVMLNHQLTPTEHLIEGSAQCQSATSANRRVGDVATTVRITVTVTCNERVATSQSILSPRTEAWT